ncbi:Hypothetical_protein [Hexamita inflata]|uniref:Hypothetical_protein n=1 Tax=Hexamita inflata TaxID=28002 RepID=A0AA86PIG8_9EUKA|nr:Hypothetical protein HINF_LOCUS24160 [Hexamita inflata]
MNESKFNGTTNNKKYQLKYLKLPEEGTASAARPRGCGSKVRRRSPLVEATLDRTGSEQPSRIEDLEHEQVREINMRIRLRVLKSIETHKVFQWIKKQVKKKICKYYQKIVNNKVINTLHEGIVDEVRESIKWKHE